MDTKTELEIAKERCEELYLECRRSGDIKTALQAQKEINRINNVYERSKVQEERGRSEAEEKLDIIRDWILPLQLADPEYPIEEHIRIAAGRLRRHNLMGNK